MRRAFRIGLAGWLGAVALVGQTRTEPPIDVQHYVIEADINQNTQTIQASVEVRFIAQEDYLRSVPFELNNALKIIRVEGSAGEALTSDRDPEKFTIRVNFPEAIPKGGTGSIRFQYEGRLAGREESPIYGIKFAAIQPDYAYLLYPSRWFPVSGYTTDRFTAKLRITVAEDREVIASGFRTKGESPMPGRQVFEFDYTQPSFPGSLAVVSPDAVPTSSEGVNARLYFRGEERAFAQAYGEQTGRIMSFLSSLYGLPPQADLTLIQTEEGAPLGYSAPGVLFLAPSALREEPNIRALANQIARQWWGGLVSHATREHIWLINGLARYAEDLYIEHALGASVMEEHMRDTYIDALTIEDIPVIQAARYEDYSPEFWALSASKGAAVLHMLRYVMGDDKFGQLLKQFPEGNAWKSVTTADFRRVAEEIHGDGLQYFFIQWIETTGAPEFRLEYTIFRTGQGFRIMGKVSQDLDTFRMPVRLRIETEGNPEFATAEVVGTSSEFVVETFAKPKAVAIDPDGRLLRYDNRIRVDVAVRRGEQFAEIGEFGEALKEYQKALEVNRNSSLAHYRIGEIFFLQNNYQSAANEFREALNGDLAVKWVEVWSHINLGKIFDLTGQRERATNEYNQAIRTKDNTQGAQEEAARYLREPYQRRDSRV